MRYGVSLPIRFARHFLLTKLFNFSRFFHHTHSYVYVKTVAEHFLYVCILVAIDTFLVRSVRVAFLCFFSSQYFNRRIRVTCFFHNKRLIVCSCVDFSSLLLLFFFYPRYSVPEGA